LSHLLPSSSASVGEMISYLNLLRGLSTTMLLPWPKVCCSGSSISVRWEITHLTWRINLVNISKILSWLWADVLHIVTNCANFDFWECTHLISMRSKEPLSVRFVTLSIFSWIKSVPLFKG
jgi:hypothetical protein